MGERPVPVGAFAGRAIGDAGLLQVPIGGAETALDVGGRERAEGLEEAAPDRARPVLADILVGNARQAGVVAHPLRHPALPGRALFPAASWPVVSAIPTLPENAILQCGSGVLKSRVRGNSRLRSSRGGSIFPGVWP